MEKNRRSEWILMSNGNQCLCYMRAVGCKAVHWIALSVVSE